MRYVVTGIAGFIGSHLAEVLTRAGHEVVGIDCMTPYYDVRMKEENAAPFEVVRADLATEAVDGVLRGRDGVFHMAGQPGVRSFGEVFGDYVHHNLLASRRLFESAAATGLRVVFASSSSVYGEAERYPTPEGTMPLPLSPYGVTKLGCEHLARAYARGFGLDVVVLRYFTVYGPRQRPDMAFSRIADALLNGSTFDVYGDGMQSRSFTFVDDAVQATVAAMTDAPAGIVYNVGGGSEATVREAISEFERVAGTTLDVRFLAAAAGEVTRTAADISRIGTDLGWRPEVELQRGVRAQWEWMVERLRRPLGDPYPSSESYLATDRS